MGFRGEDPFGRRRRQHGRVLSNRELARLLGIGEAAANKRYIRALQRLRGLLQNLGISDAR